MKYSRLYPIGQADDAANSPPAAAPPGEADNDAQECLFDLFRAAFHTHARRAIGAFDPATPDAALAQALRGYCGGDLDAAALGEQLAGRLRQALAAAEWRQAGYLWVAVEQSGEEELVYLFFFQQEESLFISSQLRVETGYSVAPGKLQFGAKVHVAEYRQQSSTCLSWLAPKNQQPLTLAWNAFVGFAAGIDRAAQTEQLLGVIERYAEALPPEKEEDYRTRAVDYCRAQDRLGEPVSMEALSRHVDEAEPEALLRFVAEQPEAPAPELYTDRSQLKRYTRFYGRDQDLSISFSTLVLGRHILYDEAGDTLTIRAIPKSLKSQLARHGRKRGDR